MLIFATLASSTGWRVSSLQQEPLQSAVAVAMSDGVLRFGSGARHSRLPNLSSVFMSPAAQTRQRTCFSVN
jgi:hypothetical protein